MRMTMTGAAMAAVALAVALGLGAPAAEAQGTVIGVVDMMQVGDGYTRYRETRELLERRKSELQVVVDEGEREVMAMIEELEAVRATASQDDIRRRRDEIEKRDRELREFVATTNAQFRDELDTLQFRTRDEVESVVTALARARALDVVLEKNLALFSAAALDVTEAVITELNRRFPPLPPVSQLPTRPAAAAPPTTSFPATNRSATGETRGWPFRPGN